jgi:carbamoyltransferase
MLVLGIQKDHRSSVALFDNENLIYFNQEERLSKVKQSSIFPVLCLDQVKKIIKNKINKVIISGYDNDSISIIGCFLKKLNIIDSEEQVFHYYKSHHLVHAAKAFYNSNFEDAIVFVVDGRGSSYNLSNGQIAYETTSIFYVKKPNIFKCIYKKLFTNSKINKNLKVIYNVEYELHSNSSPLSLDNKTKFEITNTQDIGLFYSIVSTNCGFFEEEGKLMGLNAYGKFNKKIFKLIKDKNLFIKNNIGKQNYLTEFNHSFIKNKDNLTDLSFLTQQKFEKDYFNLIKKYFKDDFSNNFILTGGTAYNVVNNYKIKKKLKNKNLFIEPMCGDEGNSIGACQLYLKQEIPNLKFNNFKNLFIGEKYEYKLNLKKFNFLNKKIKLTEVIELLIKGNIVALYQGRSEAGPRALGNRSLLLDPRIINGKDIMNTVKKREFFRPFACSVLKEKTNQWFDMGGLNESPFMSYAVQVLNHVKNKIPSVIHVDNTCRVQTVTTEDNFILYNLLKEFDKKTGVPILMNTSLNLAGETLVETPEDALLTLQKSALKFLYFPDINQLIFKK